MLSKLVAFVRSLIQAYHVWRVKRIVQRNLARQADSAFANGIDIRTSDDDQYDAYVKRARRKRQAAEISLHRLGIPGGAGTTITNLSPGYSLEVSGKAVELPYTVQPGDSVRVQREDAEPPTLRAMPAVHVDLSELETPQERFDVAVKQILDEHSKAGAVPRPTGTSALRKRERMPDGVRLLKPERAMTPLELRQSSSTFSDRRTVSPHVSTLDAYEREVLRHLADSSSVLHVHDEHVVVTGGGGSFGGAGASASYESPSCDTSSSSSSDSGSSGGGCE
jgi:hypothetical protein